MILVAFGAAWLGAMFFAFGLHAPWWLFPAALLLVSPLVLAFAPGTWPKVLAVAVVLSSVAGWRADTTGRAPPEWSGLVGNEVVFAGRVVSEPDPGGITTSYEVEVREVSSPVSMDGGGRVLISLPQFAERLPLHASIEIRGDLRLPPAFEDFDYRKYLQRRGVFGSMFTPTVTTLGDPGRWDVQSRLSDLRLRLEDGLRRALPEPQGTLAAGIAFGRDQGISHETKEDFARSGMAHLVAVSGTNVTLVAAIALVLAAPYIGRGRATVLAMGLVVVYVPLAGLSWSVLRSGIMATILLVGWFAGRPQSGLAGLSLAIIAMSAIGPAAVIDPGFQLSVAATAGLIVFGPWLIRGLENGARALRIEALAGRSVAVVVGLSLAANLATAPIILFHFGRLPLASIVANLIAEPLFAIVFVASWVVAGLSLLSPTLAWVAGLGAYYPLALLTWLAEVTARWPSLAVEDGKFWLATSLMLLAMAGGLPLYLRQPRFGARPGRPKKILRRYGLAAAGGVAATAIVSLGLAPLAEPGTLRIEVLDVGQGDATLITTPGGTRVLVDGGPSGYELLRELGAVLPHWDRGIDVVVLTHADQDHVAGFANLQERYQVGAWFDNGAAADTPAFAAYSNDVANRQTLLAGQQWEVDGVRIEVLWPPPGEQLQSSNAGSIVLRVTYGEVSFLLPGDIEGDALRRLAADERFPSTVFKVPHHGSKTSDPGSLLAARATIAIISSGCENNFGHPAAPTLDALAGTKILRTDVNGRISISTDGRSMMARYEREGAAAEQTPGGAACRR